MGTRGTIDRWIALFNTADAEAIARLYAVDAVNRQIAVQPVEGRQAIEEMHRRVFADKPVGTPVNLFVDGEWAALEWIDPRGVRGCGFFHVRDGLIIVRQRGYWDSAQLRAVYPNVH